MILSNSTYMVTRSCVGHAFLLRPDEELVKAIEYCLAEAAMFCGILLHAYCFLSNHYHLVLTDPDRRLPEFMMRFNRNLAKCVNAYRKRKDYVFSSGSYNAVRLTSLDSLLAKIVYVVTNMVAAGLVRRSSEWPGLWSDLRTIGTTRMIKRPDIYFPGDSTMPAEVPLTLHAPRCEERPDMTADEWKTMASRAHHEKEESIRREFAEQGRSFLGREAVLSVSPEDSPQRLPRQERGEGGDRIRPRVADRNPERRKAALKRLRDFLDAYREALKAFLQGIKDVVFPAGTYKMRVFFGVACACESPLVVEASSQAP